MKLGEMLKDVLKFVFLMIDEIVVGIFLFVIFPSVGIRVPLSLSVTVIALLVIKDIAIVPSFGQILRKKAEVGIEALIGKEAVVVEDLTPEGIVKIGNEYWRAECINGKAKAGERVKVVRTKGLKLLVECQE
ncbi:NfeD family protein [Thermococcus sp.]